MAEGKEEVGYMNVPEYESWLSQEEAGEEEGSLIRSRKRGLRFRSPSVEAEKHEKRSRKIDLTKVSWMGRKLMQRNVPGGGKGKGKGGEKCVDTC